MPREQSSSLQSDGAATMRPRRAAARKSYAELDEDYVASEQSSSASETSVQSEASDSDPDFVDDRANKRRSAAASRSRHTVVTPEGSLFVKEERSEKKSTPTSASKGKKSFVKGDFVMAVRDLKRKKMDVVYRVEDNRQLVRLYSRKGASADYAITPKSAAFEAEEPWKYLLVQVANNANAASVTIIRPMDAEIKNAITEYDRREPISDDSEQDEQKPKNVAEESKPPKAKKTVSSESKKTATVKTPVADQKPPTPPVKAPPTPVEPPKPKAQPAKAKGAGRRSYVPPPDFKPVRLPKTDAVTVEDFYPYIQLLFRNAIDRSFLERILADPADDENRWKAALDKIEVKTTALLDYIKEREKLVPEIVDICERYTCRNWCVVKTPMHLVVDPNEQAYRCRQCEVADSGPSFVKAKHTFEGPNYDRNSLIYHADERKSGDRPSCKVIALCSGHGTAVDRYFSLTHMRYNIFLRCCKKLALLRCLNPDKTDEDLVEKMTGDKPWMSTVASNYIEIYKKLEN